MNESANHARVRGLILLGLTGIVLGVARWLDPSPEGHGTHTQLGLFPCTFLTLTGWPCPLCGATTTFALLADLRIREGISNQPFAAFLFLTTVCGFGLGLLEALWPRGRWTRLADLAATHDLTVAVMMLAGLILGWTYKIAIS